jgi:hypothetical protein
LRVILAALGARVGQGFEVLAHTGGEVVAFGFVERVKSKTYQGAGLIQIGPLLKA